MKNLQGQLYIEPRDTQVSLNGRWQYTWTDAPCDAPEGLTWTQETKLPASVYWSLYESGVLPHPYEKDNAKRYDWVDGKVWYYRRTFALPSRGEAERAFLCFDGVAYAARVWLNGECLGAHEGMFGGPVAEVANRLLFGAENELIVEVRACTYGGGYAFQSPENRAIVPWNVARDRHTSNGHFIVLGIWRDVRLCEKDTGICVLAHAEAVPLLDYERIGVHDGYREANFVQLDLTLPDARYWHPVGLGDANLYDVTITLEDADTVLDTLRFDFGVRTIAWERTPGRQYRSRWDAFQPVINGRRFFLKGVNWMPVDFLYREVSAWNADAINVALQGTRT